MDDQLASFTKVVAETGPQRGEELKGAKPELFTMPID